jgi:integrase/recombinase XerD
VIIEDYLGQDPAMGSSQPSGPALVAAAADADPVALLVAAWLSARRSENTRVGYARDIGITSPRRPGRAPSWLAWCREQGVHPVAGVTVLHVARYARELEAAGLSPASAARKLAAISSWYAWLARRGHISASPAAGTARPRPGPGTPSAPALTSGQVLALIHAADTAPGSQRARTAALTAVLLFAGARLSEVTGADVADLGTSGGRRVLWVTRVGGRRQALPLPGPAASRIDAYLAGRPGPRPGAVCHPVRRAAVPRGRAADPAPPRRPGGPARRPGPSPGTAHDPALRHGGRLQPLAGRHSC